MLLIIDNGNAQEEAGYIDADVPRKLLLARLTLSIFTVNTRVFWILCMHNQSGKTAPF